MTRSSILFAVTIAGVGCGGPRTTPPSAARPQPRPAPAPAQPAPEQIVEASPNLGVAAEVLDECTVQIADLGKAPKFDYDETDLLAADRELLERIATCVIDGPLAGRSLRLIGRADPRGSQEYNLGLGTQRAKTVSTYLQRVGVPGTQISITTRGDLDARGRDEPTWRGDRRVDMELATGAGSEN